MERSSGLLRLNALVALACGMLAALAFACGGSEQVVERTVIVEKQVPGEKVVQTVIVEKQVPGEKVVQTVVVEKQVPGEKVVQTVVVEKQVAVEKVVTQVVVAIPTPATTVAPAVLTGTVNVAASYVPPPLYLPSAQPSPEYWIVHAWGITETLLRTDPVTPPTYGVPSGRGIATSWGFSRDGKIITFKIREGVRFHGGGKDLGPLTAADVAFSFNDAGREGSRAARATFFSRDMFKWTAVDDQTVTAEVNLNTLDPNWAYSLSNEVGQSSIVSKKLFDSLGEQQAIITPNGTGPWNVTKQTGNDELIATAVVDHWRFTPRTKTLRIVQIKEPAAVVAALETKEIDIAEVPSALVTDAVKSTNGKKREINIGNGENIFFSGNFWAKKDYLTGEAVPAREGFKPDANHPWIGNPDDPVGMEKARKVRQALAAAIDRDLINKTVLAGLGKPIYTQNGFNPADKWWKDEWMIKFDPDGAKKLLAEAGYPNGFKMGYWVPADSPFVNPEVGLAVGEMWRAIGIDVKVESTTYAARRPTLVARSIDTPWMFINQSESGIDGRKLDFRFQTTPGWNSGVELPTDVMQYEIDRRQLQDDRNRDKRIEMNAKIEDYHRNWMVATSVVELVKWFVVNDTVEAWTPHRHNENGQNSFESVILSAKKK